MVLLGLMLLLRLGWGWWVGRQVAGILAEIRARGEPVVAADVVYPALADSENALVVLKQAAGALVSGVDSPRSTNFEFPDYPPYPAKWTTLAEASEKAHGKAFALARMARSLPRAQVAQTWISPAAKFGVVNMNGLKELANTLSDGAIYVQINGDDQEAVGRLMDVLHIGRSVCQDDALISQLVGIGCEALACDSAQIIAPGLRFEAGSTARPVTRQTVKELMGLLLDERLEAAGWRQAILSERIWAIDVLRMQSSGMWVIQSLAERQLIRDIPNFKFMLEAVGASNWPQAQQILGRGHWEKSENGPNLGSLFGGQPALVTPRYSRWFHIYTGDFSSVFLRRFRIVAERRMTAVILACQLYRADHKEWPERLEQLVPDYLARVPADPFREDGGPLGYVVVKKGLPGGGDRPVVYNSEGDPTAPVPREPSYGFYTGLAVGLSGSVTPRQYRDVSRFTPAPSTKAVNNKPYKPYAP